MRNFWLDVILIVLFVAEMSFHFLPKVLHEILGADGRLYLPRCDKSAAVRLADKKNVAEENYFLDDEFRVDNLRGNHFR